MNICCGSLCHLHQQQIKPESHNSKKKMSNLDRSPKRKIMKITPACQTWMSSRILKFQMISLYTAFQSFSALWQGHQRMENKLKQEWQNEPQTVSIANFVRTPLHSDLRLQRLQDLCQPTQNVGQTVPITKCHLPMLNASQVGEGAMWADCPACDHTACPVLKHPSHLSNMQPSAGPPDSRYPSIHLKPQGMRGSTKLKTLKTAMTNGMKRLEVSLSWELLWFSNMFNCKMSIGETSGGLYGTQKDLYRPQRRPLRHPKRPLRTHPWGIDLSWQTRKAAVSFLWPGQPTQRTSSLPLPKPSPLKINMHANMDLKSKT